MGASHTTRCRWVMVSGAVLVLASAITLLDPPAIARRLHFYTPSDYPGHYSPFSENHWFYGALYAVAVIVVVLGLVWLARIALCNRIDSADPSNTDGEH